MPRRMVTDRWVVEGVAGRAVELEEGQMLIEDYDLEVTTVPCEPGSEVFAAIARLNVNITPILPYLNRVLRGAVYNPRASALSWKKGGRNIVFWPFRIAIGHLSGREEAEKIAQGLVKRVNQVWERRAKIEPNYEVRRRLGPMEVYQLLPRTNCRACGQPTCFVFATKLVAGQVKPADCLALQESQYAEPREKLEEQFTCDLPSIG